MNRKAIRSAINSFVDQMATEGELVRKCLIELRDEHKAKSTEAYAQKNRNLMAWHMQMIKKINTVIHEVQQ